MSLYDKASLIFSGAAGAGNKDVAYNIKPVEKLKVDELIVNGGFDTDSDWTKSGESASDVTMTISGGRGRIQTEGSSASFNQYNVFEEGKTYKISLELEVIEGSVKIDTLGKQITSNLGTGKHSLYFTPEAGQNEIRIVRGEPGEDNDFYVDNVSVREVEQKANDFSFVRASDLTATYEGADGLIKKTRENLLVYSNQFDNTDTGIWTNGNAPTVTANQSGYDGTTNAFKLTKDTNLYRRVQQNVTSISGVYTLSVYAKADTLSAIALRNGGTGVGGLDRVEFNLANGTFTLHNNSVAGNMEAITGQAGDTDRWYRCSATFTDASTQMQIYVDIGEDDAGSVFIQNAQLEQGSVATPYIHRTDSYSKSTAGIQEGEPRYDYSLNNALPPALLYEPERKNDLKHSEHIKASFWSALNTITVTSNDSTSPEGLENATSVDGGDDYPILKTDDVTLETSTDYVFSFYAKNVDATDVHYRVYDEDLNTDIVSSTSYFSQLSTTEWNRIKVPFTTHSSSTNYKFYLVSGDMNGKILVWGAQVEKGSCVTSYIPTYGIAATRKGDTIPQYTPSKTNPDKYTFFAHSHSDRVTSDNRAPRLKGDGNSTLMGHFVNASGKKQFFFDDNEANRPLSKTTFGSFEAGDDTKYAFVVDNIALEAKLFIDGVLRETFSLTERADAKILSVGNSDGNPDRIKSIMYFPEALEDADVVSLTT